MPAGVTSTARRLFHTPVGLAVVTAIAYYLGVQVGLALRFPPATTSVLWPPNSILTALLLVAPVRLWWVALVAALPVHLFVQSTLGWPVALVGTLFVTNCSEALIAAGLIRRFSDEPTRFDTLRRVGALIVGAGIVAPVLSSFADAAAVHLFRGEPYWQVWRTRAFANSLTALSVVPLVVLAATSGASHRRLRAQPVIELGLVLAGLTAVLVLWLDGSIARVLPGVPATVFLLPFFFWAAVRFGTGGISAALLISALTTSVVARAGSRPFTTLTPQESLLALQIYLVVMAVPLFVLAALLDERRRAMAALDARLRSESLLAWASGSFVQVPSDRIGDALRVCLQRIGEFFAVDRVLIIKLSTPADELRIVQQWTAPGIAELPPTYSCSLFPWAVARLLAGEDVVCDTPDALPADASNDRRSFVALGLQSALVLPLIASNTVVGAVSLHMLSAERRWDESTVAHVRRLAAVLANALARQRSDDALRASESMKTAILASLSSLVAVLDRHGMVIAANERWHDATARPAGSDLIHVGVNYLALWSHLGVAAAPLSPDGHDSDSALASLIDILEGRGDGFSCEYASNDDDSWFAMTVVPLRRAEGGAVVTHVDITERKRAESDAQRARQELAHFSRVSTMGELTASLAHQLNQPLASILSNAEAAARLLAKPQPDIDLLREIVADIIADDKRAGGVIRRTRDLMTNSAVSLVSLDLNGLVRDVALLMTSDAVIRNVSVALDLTRDAPHVHGDRIQLQQVVLNLLVNAIEAVSDRPASERGIIVRTEPCGETAIVSVRDSGAGFRNGSATAMFEPFVTTKNGGMGMGLAIARSIVESHGGRVWAENNPDRGATVFVSLPAVPS